MEVFISSDVDPSVGEAIEKTLNVAGEYWGLWWPVEYWVMGLEEKAGRDLVDQFCARRDARSQWDYDDCMEREAGPDDHSMMSYQRLGAKAVAAEQPSLSAGRNGTADWGIHRFASSLPWGLAGLFGIPGEEEVKTVLHEYWHAVQHSHILTLNRDKRDELLGPVWFVEGSAEYMSQYGLADLKSQGLLPEVPMGDWPFALEDQMENKLRIVDDALSGECKGRELTSITEYSDPCSYLGYDMGAWASAYLMNIAGNDVLLEQFYPDLESTGWQASFEKVAGMSLDQFNSEFMEFIGKSTEERMAILPVFPEDKKYENLAACRTVRLFAKDTNDLCQAKPEAQHHKAQGDKANCNHENEKDHSRHPTLATGVNKPVWPPAISQPSHK